MKTISELIETMPGAPFKSHASFNRAVFRHVVRVTGCEPLRAAYDPAGNCRVCGEAGRCPGWHTFGEVSRAIAATP